MRLFRNWRGAFVIAAISVLGLAAYAEIPAWLQWLPAASPASSILYRVVPSVGGSTSVRRPPRETAPQLSMLSAKTPSDAELVALTAREYEAQLDFANAEARWKSLDFVSQDHAQGQIALADYYHRRMQPQQELQALAAADSKLPAVDDPLQPENQQRAFRLHERAQQLIRAQALPPALATQDFERWITKYPAAETVYQRYFDFLIANGMLIQSSQLLERYQRSFPNNRTFPIRARVALAEKRGSPGGAIAVYEAAFDPLWPQELLDGYFSLLARSHKLFDFYQNAQRAVAARPLDLAPATRLFHYYRKQNDVSGARRALSEFRIRKEAAQASWTAAELSTLAKLFDSVDDYEEVIRYAYALYSLPGADQAAAEEALVSIVSTLLKAPDQPIRFGRGDLSFYRDVATMDASPGFLNGILSLIFNSQSPDSQFRSQQGKSEAYFHRAKAAELYVLLSDRFPGSRHRSELLSRLVESYASYGEDEPIIRQGTAFINDFPNAEQRTRVALQVADAYARRKQVPEELAVYDRLLAELALKAQRVPLGGSEPRSSDYARVLQRYVSRLSQLNRIPDALALYRREIDRNPDDPGLYDRLADFLGANPRAGDVAQVYRQAMQRFQDRSWWHKLARFYLRNRLAGELRLLSQQAVDTFSGSDLEQYVANVVVDPALDRRLQLEINLYAHTRFPHDLRFVHNLIALYSGGATADPAALTRLLSDHWYEDESIRRMFFERLAAAGNLGTVVQTAVNLLPPAGRRTWTEAESANPAVTRFIAEAEVWQSHFETAATVMRAVAEAYPADPAFAGRASDLYRSLAAYDASNIPVAVSIAENLSQSEPRDRQRLTRMGEIYADHEFMSGANASPIGRSNQLVTAARSVWDRIPDIEPGGPEGYLEAATLFWDYLRPDDAQTWLRRGRVRLKMPALWAYEMGAIFESQGRRGEAIGEYIEGALRGRSNAAQARLLQLSTRQDYRRLIDEQTARRMDSAPDDPDVLQLRISVLRAQQRNSDVEALLRSVVGRTASREILSYIRRVADEGVMRPIQERVIRREAQLESDPQQQLRLRLELAHFLEAGGDLTAAQAELEAIYQANSLLSGVIRATADYYWRHDKPRAIRVLATAAERAHPSLKTDYLVETVRKSIEAKDDAQALQSAQALLAIDPINGQFIALMADALAAGGKEAEVQQLYVSKITEIQQSQIAQAEKTDRIAAVRRGLIPLLTRQDKFREALDQYIEIVNRFPDDENVLAETGRFASQHGLQAQLISYYAKTVETSPRDPRWSIILARVQTQFENYPAAIEAYTKAMTARPERQDLAINRADLEERTYRFADAIVTYNRIYELSKKNPIWMERIAVLQARLGQNREAIASLRRAYIENRPEPSREYGRVALILEEHGMIDEAADFIQQQFSSGAAGRQQWERPYARIMTRARKSQEALPQILNSDNANGAREMGQAVALYYTPEEREAFVRLLSEKRPAAGQRELPYFTVMANSARLYDLEVKWRLEEAKQGIANGEALPNAGTPFVALQQRRMRFAELARQLEDFAASMNPTVPDRKSSLLTVAMRAYQAIGDSASELRMLSNDVELQVRYRQRYFELLEKSRPDELLSIAARTHADGVLAIQTFIAAGDVMRALAAIQTQKTNPVWIDAYTGLAGLYFGVDSPEVRSAFQRVLGPQLIGERLGKQVNRAEQAAGDIWFYYGQRYGEYLRDTAQSQDVFGYLLSEVESRPGNRQAYVNLAEYYRDKRDFEHALAEFRHASELNSQEPGIHSKIALVLWDMGRRDEAVTEWKAALAQFEKLPRSAAGPMIMRDIRSRGQEGALRAEIDSALRAAARTLQVWELPPLLEAAFENSSEDQRLLSIIDSSRSPGQLIGTLSYQQWVAPQQQKLLLERAVRLLSGAGVAAQVQYYEMRQRYLDYLLDHNEVSAARQLLDSFSDAEKRGVQVQELRLAAAEGTLQALLERYRQSSSSAPPDWVLQQTAVALDRTGQSEASRRVLEFLYGRQIENSSRNTAAFLGLAEIRLKQGRLDDALELLKRLNLLSAVPFENLVASARVLSAAGRPAEAEEFLKLRIQAAPWDDEARVESGTLQNLQAVVASPRASYDVRTRAVRLEAKNGSRPSGSTGSRELDLLSGRTPMTVDAAGTPYFFAARIAAAEQSADANVRARLLLGAVAERPDDSNVRKLLFSSALEARQYQLALAAYSRGEITDPEIAEGMGEAHLQIGQPDDAARFFGLAASEERDTTRKQALAERQKQALAINDRIIEDERRRPVIRTDLDQPQRVGRR